MACGYWKRTKAEMEMSKHTHPSTFCQIGLSSEWTEKPTFQDCLRTSRIKEGTQCFAFGGKLKNNGMYFVKKLLLNIKMQNNWIITTEAMSNWVMWSLFAFWLLYHGYGLMANGRNVEREGQMSRSCRSCDLPPGIPQTKLAILLLGQGNQAGISQHGLPISFLTTNQKHPSQCYLVKLYSKVEHLVECWRNRSARKYWSGKYLLMECPLLQNNGRILFCQCKLASQHLS